MSTNRTPLYANSQTFPDQERKPKAGALRQEEDHDKRNDSGDGLASKQLGEKSAAVYGTENKSPFSTPKERSKSTKPNQAVDGVHAGFNLLPRSEKIDGADLSGGDINHEGVSTSKEQPKNSDGLKAKPQMENNKLIKEEPPKHEADFSNSEIKPHKTSIEHPLPKEENSAHHRNDMINATSNYSHHSSDHMNIPPGYPPPSPIIHAENGGVPEGVPVVLINQPPQAPNQNNNGRKIEAEFKVSFCFRCSIL